MVISGGELVLDTAGALAGRVGGDDAHFGAGDFVGGALDALVPEEPDAWSSQAGMWVYDQVGGGTTGMVLGGAAAAATNVVTAPVNLADAGIGGIVNEVGNLFDSDGDERQDYWGPAKGAIGQGASDAWDATSQGASDAWDATSQGASDAWSWLWS